MAHISHFIQTIYRSHNLQIDLQAVAEAGIKLSPKLKERAQGIREIKVETYPGIIARVADAAKFRPETKGTAGHSLPVCLAVALIDGDVTVAQFERDRWRARDVMELVEKTSVAAGAALIAKIGKRLKATRDIR